MSTTSPLLKTTNPEYATGSGLCLEVKFEGQQNWSKLRNAEPYAHNKEVSLANQIKELEMCRDSWRLRGQKKYFNAEYRIGRYQRIDGEFAWIRADLIEAH